MANDLKPVSPAVLPQGITPTAVELRQDGNNNTQIAQVEHFHSQTTNVIIAGQAQQGGTAAQGALNTQYYNLFVLGVEEFRPFSSGFVMVEKGRALTECVSSDIKDAISVLSDEAIAFLKTLPTIFAAENEGSTYGKSNDTQQAYFGFVTGINVQNRGIKVDYQILNPIPQKSLNEMIIELDIEGTNKFNEFDRTHWTVKHVPLVKLLRDKGFQIYAP